MKKSNSEPFSSIKILLLTDIHYDKIKDSLVKERETKIALELLQRTRASIVNENIDLVIALGDMLDDGNANTAQSYLKEIKKCLDSFRVPYIVIPGNHDGDVYEFESIFNQSAGLRVIGDYQFLTFSDTYTNNQGCYRDIDKMNHDFEMADKCKPIIAIQHNTVYPSLGVINGYDYDMCNAESVTKVYEQNKVLLSISGHYHKGFDITTKNEVDYLACPALCESPFRYSILTIKGTKYQIQKKSLNLKQSRKNDFHIHTNASYCADDDMTPENIIRRKKLLGLNTIGIINHAPQLYIPEKDYWSGRFVDEPEIITKFKNTPYNRMQDYKAFISAYKSKGIQLGLEVEIDKNGQLFMIEEDYVGWDFVLGAVHFLPQKYHANIKSGFMWATKRLLELNVDILAHPFRYFIRNNEPVPEDLFREVAILLAETDTAVELNFHTNLPNIKFFEECVNIGVKIAPNSDAHALYEVGLSKRYDEFIENLCTRRDLDSVLFYGRGRGRYRGA